VDDHRDVVVNPATWTGTVLSDRLEALLVVLAQALADAVGGNGRPKRTVVSAGEIAWDACDCGQLILSYENSFPSQRFPTEAIGEELVRNCGPEYQAVQITLGYQVCWPASQANGKPPREDAVTAAARRLQIDSFALLCALQNQLAAWRDGSPVLIADYAILGEQTGGSQGGCIEIARPFVIGFWSACCE
jgi:hypothetical protein